MKVSYKHQRQLFFGNKNVCHKANISFNLRALDQSSVGI